jgi:hypothetical protein
MADDGVEEFERLGKQIASEISGLLARKLAELVRYVHEQRKQMERNQFNKSLESGGLEQSSENRAMLKSWTKAYEKNLQDLDTVGEELTEVEAQIKKLESVEKLSPEAQKELGYGKDPGLKNPSVELDNLRSKQIKLEGELQGLERENQAFQKGQGLETLKENKSFAQSLKEKVTGPSAKEKEKALDSWSEEYQQTESRLKEIEGIKESQEKAIGELGDMGLKATPENIKGIKTMGLRPGQTPEDLDKEHQALTEKLQSLKQGKGLEKVNDSMAKNTRLQEGILEGNKITSEGGRVSPISSGKKVRPGSVFDSLAKSGYVEKGGLEFMHKNEVGVKQGKIGVSRR